MLASWAAPLLVQERRRRLAAVVDPERLANPVPRRLKSSPDVVVVELPGGDAREMNQGAPDEYNIMITARPRGSLPTELWNSSYFVFVEDDAFDKKTSRP